MLPLQILKNARKLISKHQNWTKGALAKDTKGKGVDEFSSKACRFCALGAVSRSMPKKEYEDPILNNRCLKVWNILDEAAGLTSKYSSAVLLNDAPETTHKDVMKLYNKAIKLAQEEN